MRKQNSETIGEALRRFFDESPALRQKIGESRITAGWHETMGSMVASYTTSLYIRHSVLYVHLSSSTLRSELFLHRRKLIAKLNTHAGFNVLTDIVFR